MSPHTLLLFYLNLKLCEQITIQNEWCFLRWENVGIVSPRLANTRVGASSPTCCLLFSLSSSSDLASPLSFLSFLADSLPLLGSKNTSTYTVLATCVGPYSKGSCVDSLTWSLAQPTEVGTITDGRTEAQRSQAADPEPSGLKGAELGSEPRLPEKTGAPIFRVPISFIHTVFFCLFVCLMYFYLFNVNHF